MDPRLGARVLLLDADDRVLLLHARDPDDPARHWWELPGGGVEPGESVGDAAVREVAEETGIVVDRLGPCLWIRESRFHYRGRDHHRLDHIHLGRVDDPAPATSTNHTDAERLGLIEHRWVTAEALRTWPDELVPPELPGMLRTATGQELPAAPVHLPNARPPHEAHGAEHDGRSGA